MTTLGFFNLKRYINEYGVQVFIETGTYRGAGLEYALGFDFKAFWSIEFWKQTFDEVSPRFNHMDVSIVHGHSPEVLRELLITIQEPCLFWLDAHFPNSDVAARETSGIQPGLSVDELMPLRAELEVISKLRHGEDVILVDDLCLFENGDFENGNCGWVDEGRFYKLDLSAFADTHVINKYYSTSGYLEMLPKAKGIR